MNFQEDDHASIFSSCDHVFAPAGPAPLNAERRVGVREGIEYGNQMRSWPWHSDWLLPASPVSELGKKQVTLGTIWGKWTVLAMPLTSGMDLQ
ncbi:hypothetical protein PG985_008648 [Apiospora marii]|uniref:uncharacterized protein n=1 Tax=Apiospora marii TaxID=335849 RepID=UPI0031328349